jgi:hypothetical protein
MNVVLVSDDWLDAVSLKRVGGIVCFSVGGGDGENGSSLYTGYHAAFFYICSDFKSRHEETSYSGQRNNATGDAMPNGLRQSLMMDVLGGFLADAIGGRSGGLHQFEKK